MEHSPYSSLLSRFWQYQKERYPFMAYLILIGTFSFSAVSFSRISRGEDTFISWDRFAVCVFNTLTIFFLVRVFDEFKDHEDDVKYRKGLPVPRGLINLSELRKIGWAFFGIQLGINLLFSPEILPLLCLVLAYLGLMGKEFFIAEWLKKHQFWYITSHMLIIPLVDVFASGFDWYLNDVSPPKSLIFFFLVSYMNGVVLEIGRKIKSPEAEEVGVLSYTKQLGTRTAVFSWIFLLLTTLLLASSAMKVAGIESIYFTLLLGIGAICLIPSIAFLIRPVMRNAKMIEYGSALWTLGLYLCMGGLSMLSRLI